MTDLVKQAEALGWSYEPTSLFDEEAVEGWLWTSPSGIEYYEIGAWNEQPVLPDDLLSKLAPVLTIQIDKWGVWMNVEDHGCSTEAEMNAYIAGRPDQRYRIADQGDEGELSGSKVLTFSEIIRPAYDRADDTGKANFRKAVSAVIEQLRKP